MASAGRSAASPEPAKARLPDRSHQSRLETQTNRRGVARRGGLDRAKTIGSLSA